GGDAARPEGEDQVAGPGQLRQAGQHVGPLGEVDDPLAGPGLADRLEDQPARDTGLGRLPGGVDVGQDDDVGVTEGVAEVAPEPRRAAVAVGLEDGDDAGPLPLPGGGQRGLDLAGEVGVVVDQRDAVDLALELEAPGHAGEAAERRPDGVEGDADLDGQGGGAGGVAGVVPARSREEDLPQPLAPADEVEPAPEPVGAGAG